MPIFLGGLGRQRALNGASNFRAMGVVRGACGGGRVRGLLGAISRRLRTLNLPAGRQRPGDRLDTTRYEHIALWHADDSDCSCGGAACNELGKGGA